ncbi:alpha/beta hydrolase [Kiritimatiellaeota bacterium B1221]|nr:alpha/beta hydrolase [Kiritimatiellaeota bacterium B1221]
MQAAPSINLPQPLPLWPDQPKPFASEADGEFPNLTVYLPAADHRTGQTVLILPGGGYQGVCSDREGHRPAQYLNAHGIAAAVLEYRHAPQRHPVPLCDAQRAMRVLKGWAEKNGLNPGQVGVMGHSAGGHLAGSLSTQPEVPESKTGDATDAYSCLPAFTVLLYPVVSFTTDYAHLGSRKNLLGEPADADLVQQLSIEKAVTSETPPMFIVHAQDDPGVKVSHSLGLFKALTEKGVEADLHIYAKGGHGFGMAHNHEWGPTLLRWLGRQ